MPKLSPNRERNLRRAQKIANKLKQEGERVVDISDIMNRSQIWVYKAIDWLNNKK